MKRRFLISGTILFLSFILLSGHQANAQKHSSHKHCSEDSTEFNMGGMKFIKMGEDSMLVCFNHHNSNNFNMSCMPFRHYKNKYNGHWAGVEIGWNGYVNSDFNMTFPDKYRYLSLNTSRSLMVNINPFELNLNLSKNHFGLTSGLGLQINNYYFSDKNYYFISDSAAITAFRMYDVSGNPVTMDQSKMVVTWLTLPLLFEYQTNAKMKLNSFHFSAGVVGGVRIGQYVKKFYPGINQTYTLKDDNGKTVGAFSSSEYLSRDHSQFHLSQFKLDATARIGWSFINLFATYSLTPMFQKDQGPELNTWNVGITLVGW